MQTTFNSLLKTCLVIFLIGCQGEEPISMVTISEQNLAYGNFSLNGKLLATTDYVGNNTLWDVKNSKIIYKLTDVEKSKTKNFSDIYNKIVITDNLKMVFANSGHRLEIWDTSNGQTINNYATSGIINSFDLNNAGTQALIGYNDHSVQLLNTKTRNLIWKVKYNANIEKVDLSSDGLYGLVSLDNGNSDLWQVTKNEILHTFKHNNKPLFIAISPENRYVLIAVMLEPVKIYDLHSGELLYELLEYSWLSPKLFKNNAFQIKAASFNKDLSTLITATLNGKILIWDLQTGAIIRELELPKNFLSGEIMPNIIAVTYNEDNSLIYGLSSNGRIYTWQYKK